MRALAAHLLFYNGRHLQVRKRLTKGVVNLRIILLQNLLFKSVPTVDIHALVIATI